jgi:hypothetical protein
MARHARHAIPPGQPVVAALASRAVAFGVFVWGAVVAMEHDCVIGISTLFSCEGVLEGEEKGRREKGGKSRDI